MTDQDKVKAAIAVFDKSAERTTPNAQTEAWATLRAYIEGLESELSAVRSLMNLYNLGGWTDAVAPMMRAEAAEARVRELEGLLRDAPSVLAYAMNMCNSLASEDIQAEAVRQIAGYNARVRAAMRGEDPQA